MNIFVLAQYPAAAASLLADVHVRKMCLETAQILSSVIVRDLGKEALFSIVDAGGPKEYNIMHPVIQAVQLHNGTAGWLLDHNSALHREYECRFGKQHAYSNLVQHYMDIFRDAHVTNYNAETYKLFCRCFGDFKPSHGNLVLAYRDYYKHKKQTIRNWKYTNKSEPSWLH